MVNIRTKGQDGEREICKLLNAVYLEVLTDIEIEHPNKEDLPFQRNQLQTAVGGSDIANPFKLAIEVKRQEALSVGSWWAQCKKSAERASEIPVLIYRKNRQKWSILMESHLPIADGKFCIARSEIEVDAFKLWLYYYLLELV